MKKQIIILLMLTCTILFPMTCGAQYQPPPQRSYYPNQNIPHQHQPNIPNKMPAHPNPMPVHPNPMPMVPTPMPPIIQHYPNAGMYVNVGDMSMHGINITGSAGTMPENSSIEIKKIDMNATNVEILQNCKNNRFVALSSLYEIRTSGMNQYFGLPAKYAIMAKSMVPNGSRLFILAKLGAEVYFIPAKSSNNYGMVIGEINSCAIYDKIALIADTGYGRNYLSSFMTAASLDSNNNPLNPHYATLSENDSFGISAHIFPTNGRNGCNFSSKSMTIIQPNSYSSISIYKQYENQNIFVQKLPFTPADSYSFCKIDLSNFEIYYDDSSISYSMIIGFENTNIEDIPNALIFRATCYDDEGIKYSTEDQMVYINFPDNSYNSPFSGGNGTKSNPFIITNANQLDKIRDYRRRFFSLGCDIDLNTAQTKNWLPLGDTEAPFDGLLNGNNKTIRNLSINQPNESYQGLFGYVRNASIKNLKVELAPEGIVADSYNGVIAGYCSNTKFYQCYATGTLKGKNYIGGLIGFCDETTIRKSITNTIIDSSNEKATIGGIVAFSENTTITDCHTAAEITAIGMESSIGGIVGQGESLKLQNCYSTGTLTSKNSSHAGGLVGYMNNSEIKGCIALNKRINGGQSGRIVGTAKNSSFIRCYAWDYIRDINNKNLNEGGFNGNDAFKEGRNGESIEKKSFYGSNTRNKFWTVNKKIGFNLDSWVFNSGYSLPQLRNMPSIPNPDYLR